MEMDVYRPRRGDLCLGLRDLGISPRLHLNR